MKMSRHQRIVLAVGVFFAFLIKFDEGVSALSRMLFMPSWLASLLIILTALLWIGAVIILKKRPLHWVTKGQTFRYTKIGFLTHVLIGTFIVLLISGQIIKRLGIYKLDMAARQEQQERPQLVANEPQYTNRENDSATLLEQLAAMRQQTDDVTKLKINSALPTLMGDDSGLVIYTDGYGAIHRNQVQVVVNGQDVSSTIYDAHDSSNMSVITLIGTRKEINLHVGENVITVRVKGFTTEPHQFMVYESSYSIRNNLR